MNLRKLDEKVVGTLVGHELRELQLRRLRGGLTAASVTRATARYRDTAGKPCCRSFVIKHLRGAAAREAAVHERLGRCGLGALAPRLWAVHRAEGRACRLYMEAVRPVRRWPWSEMPAALQVMRAMSRLHASPPSDLGETFLTGWDYERELAASAGQSLEMFHRLCRERREIGRLRRFGPALRRVVRQLATMRQWLLEFAPFKRTVIHGDLHPGNVMIRTRGGQPVPVFLDWGRTRMGSPLEDVSSWLQSLGYWEPVAKRRHDTLLVDYLAHWSPPVRLGPEVRTAYWVSAASNALAGALKIHLGRLAGVPRQEAQHAPAFLAARDALRMIQRADASWKVNRRPSVPRFPASGAHGR